MIALGCPGPACLAAHRAGSHAAEIALVEATRALLVTHRDRGELYIADDPVLDADHARAQELLDRYNRSAHSEQELRERLLRELLGDVGDGVVVKPSFRCDYGTSITIGPGTFVNYDCVLLDVAPISIGSYCQIATRVQFLIRSIPSRAGMAGSTRSPSRSATTSGWRRA